MGMYEDLEACAYYMQGTAKNKEDAIIATRILEWLNSPSCALLPEYELEETEEEGEEEEE